MIATKRWRTGKTAPKDREILGRYPEGVFAIRWAPWAECYQSTRAGDYLRDPAQWAEITERGDA